MNTVEFDIDDKLEINGQILDIKVTGKYFYFPGSYLQEGELQFDFETLIVNGITAIGSSFFSPGFYLVHLEPAIFEYLQKRI